MCNHLPLPVLEGKVCRSRTDLRSEKRQVFAGNTAGWTVTHKLRLKNTHINRASICEKEKKTHFKIVTPLPPLLFLLILSRKLFQNKRTSIAEGKQLTKRKKNQNKIEKEKISLLFSTPCSKINKAYSLFQCTVWETVWNKRNLILLKTACKEESILLRSEKHYVARQS